VLIEERIKDMTRLMELIAMMSAGEWYDRARCTRRHNLLWSFGTEAYERAMEALAERPGSTRLLAAAGLSAWPGLRQYGEG
jgi:hypothetical protein